MNLNDKKDSAPDNTAVRTALWRALHVQIDDKPSVFEDEIGLQLVAPHDDWQERPDMKFTKSIRASIVARARFIDDLVIEQSQKGIEQYVILGAGLDTFAQRRPDIAFGIKIFEIDQPETLNWKQERLTELGFGTPEYLHFVPVDFESSTWWSELIKSGFNNQKPAVIVCTGVMLYLTKDAVLDTLNKMKSLAAGSTIAITFNLPIELVNEKDKQLIEISIKGAKENGTPMISFFSPEEILEIAHNVGFDEANIISTKDMEKFYFARRNDELVPASGEFFLVAKT